MAEVGDDLLDGDLDEAAFGELDGEEEDALLADDDYESYQNTRQAVFTNSSQQGREQSEMFRMVDQVQDVAEGDEIIEDGEEDILELAVVDELDESEMDNGQGNNQVWAETPSRSAEADNIRRDASVGVPSSTSNIGALGGESDEEESNDRGSRFKTERNTVISLKGVTSGKSLGDIPDSLDKVKTTAPINMRTKGGLQQRGKGNLRGRLGPMQRGGAMMMQRGGPFPMRRPNMMPPPHQQMHPRPKIHVNPHFRGGMHQPPSLWDNGRLPPPPGCESFGPPSGPYQDGNWGGPPPHHMGMRPPYHHNPPGPPPPQFQMNPQAYHPPQQPQGYEEQYHPTMEPPTENATNRIVQFSDNTQLITVENQHFQRTPYDQNFAPANNQFQSPQNPHPNFNNNVYPNQFGNSTLRPNFQPQSFPNVPQNAGGYPTNEFHQPQNAAQFQNYNNQSNWNQPHQVMDQQAPMYDQSHQAPPVFPQPTSPQFNPQFNNQNRFRTPQYPGAMRGTGVKRLVPRQNSNNTPIPVKQARFEHNKQKTPPVNIRTNLQEIKTVDNLPDTTTEPDIEEDEETKQYRLKIAEQKALREKVLREKEARRLASIIEKQKKQEPVIISAPVVKNPVVPQQQPEHKPQPKPQTRPQPQQPGRGQGRGRITSANRVIPRQPQKAVNQTPTPGTPVVQIQQMLGTMYKIVKVRTKEGAIVTRKTPLVMDQANSTITPMRTVTTAGQPQRRIVLNAPGQTALRMPNNRGRGGSVMRPAVGRGGTNSVRMVPSKNPQGRTLFTVQTIPQANIPKPPQRVVIDKRPPPNASMKVAATPNLPVSTLVTIDNLSLSTSQGQIQKLAKQVGSLCSYKHEPELKRATLKFQKATDAQQFYLKFHRKMIDLSRISVTIVPE